MLPPVAHQHQPGVLLLRHVEQRGHRRAVEQRCFIHPDHAPGRIRLHIPVPEKHGHRIGGSEMLPQHVPRRRRRRSQHHHPVPGLLDGLHRLLHQRRLARAGCARISVTRSRERRTCSTARRWPAFSQSR